MSPYIALLRPAQYAKNVLVFLPAFFALRIADAALLGRTAVSFTALCLLASAVYIFNDYRDRDADRAHPTKRLRPLAAGTVAISPALLLMAVLACTGMGLMYWLGTLEWQFALVYLVINALYSLKLKHVALLDLCLLAIGFVLRIYIGASVGSIPVSMWIVLMTFLLALFLGFAKRREDVLLAAQGNAVRKSIDGYNLEFINAAMVMMAGVLVVSYVSYTTSPEVMHKFHEPHLYTTAFFVVMGILRYMQLTFVHKKSGNPAKILLSDVFLQLTIAGWLAAFVILIYP